MAWMLNHGYEVRVARITTVSAVISAYTQAGLAINSSPDPWEKSFLHIKLAMLRAAVQALLDGKIPQEAIADAREISAKYLKLTTSWQRELIHTLTSETLLDLRKLFDACEAAERSLVEDVRTR